MADIWVIYKFWLFSTIVLCTWLCTSVQVLALNSCVCVPSIEIAEVYVNSIITTAAAPHQQCKGFQIIHVLVNTCGFFFFCFSDSSHADGCEMVSDCAFVFHRNVVIGEVSHKSFAQFSVRSFFYSQVLGAVHIL